MIHGNIRKLLLWLAPILQRVYRHYGILLFAVPGALPDPTAQGVQGVSTANPLGGQPAAVGGGKGPAPLKDAVNTTDVSGGHGSHHRPSTKKQGMAPGAHVWAFAILAGMFAVTNIHAQGGGSQSSGPHHSLAAPNGGCSDQDLHVNNSNGDFYNCKAGVWFKVSGAGGSSFYQTVQQGGAAQTQESILNFLNGTNITITCADNPGNTSTDCTFTATGGGTGSPCITTALSLQFNSAGSFGCVADFTFAAHTITSGASGILDISAASSTGGFKLPSAAGAIPTADSIPAFNTTNHTLVWGSNGVTIVGAAAATGTGTATTCSSKVVTAVSSLVAPTCTTITSAYVDNSIALTGTDINTSNQVTVTHLAAALPINQGGTATTGTLTGIVRGGNPITAAELSQDVTTSGSNAATVVQVEGAAIPTSATVLGTNGSKQLIAATPHQEVTPLQCADTSVSATTYTCTTAPSLGALTTGDTFIFTTINQANSGSSTLNVDGIGAKTIKKWQNAANLIAGDLQASTAVIVRYDGTNFELDTVGNVPTTGTVTSAVIAGTANQVTASGTCTITSTGTCTLSLPNAVTLGTDNSAAGSLQVANSGAAAHTIFASGATTSNTVAGPTVVPVTLDLLECTSAATTCTLTDTGFLASNVVRKDTANTGATGMTLDMSGATGATALKVPVIAGATAGADGVVDYDSTNKSTHVRTNSADSLVVALASAPAGGKCLQSSGVTGLAVEASGACTSGVAVNPAVSNVTPVTVNANVTSDQQAQELSLTAAYLNVLTQPFQFHGSGIFSTTLVPAVTVKFKLCSVSGCGSGTVVTLATMTTANTTSATNNQLIANMQCATAATGATGNLICHGILATDLTASSVLTTTYSDANTAVSGNFDLTGTWFVDTSIAFSTGSASNSFTEQEMWLAPLATPTATSIACSGVTNGVCNNAVNTATTAMTLDMSGATGATAFKVPVIAGATAGANGVIDYDSTNKNTHIRTNGADSIACGFASAPTTLDLVRVTVASSNVLCDDSGVLAANVVTASSNGTTKQLCTVASSNKACTWIDFPDAKEIPAANCTNTTAGGGWTTNATLVAACGAALTTAHTNNLNGVLQGTPSVGTAVGYFDFELAGDWDTATKPYIAVYYGSGENTTGTVIWTISTGCTKQDGSVTDDPSFIAESAMGTQTMAAKNRMWSQNAQLAGAMTNCIAGSTMIVKLALSGTASSSINVSKAVITVPRLLTVQAN